MCILFRSSFTLAIFVTTAMALGACTKIHQNSNIVPNSNGPVVVPHTSLPEGVVTQTSVQGIWATACIKDSNTQAVYKESFTIQGAVLTRTSTAYAATDANCTNPDELEERISNLTIIPANDVTLLTETMSSIKLTPMSTSVAAAWNKSAYCKITSWNVGVSQSITDATLCADLASTRTAHSTIFGGKELYMSNCTTDPDSTCNTIRYVKAGK